jgi:methyl-accepting chemotaxis protein
MVGSGLVAFIGINLQQANIEELHGVRFAQYASVSRLRGDMDRANAALYRVLNWSRSGYDPQKIAQESKGIQDALVSAGKAVQALSGQGKLNPEEKKLLAEVARGMGPYSKDVTDALDMIDSDPNAATMFMGQAEEKYLVLAQGLGALMSVEQRLSATTYQGSRSNGRLVLTALVASIALSLVATVALSWFINRVIMRPIRSTVEVLGFLAAGDLTRRIEVSTRDEIGAMAEDMNRFIASLHRTMDQIANTSGQVATASSQLMATAERIAAGTGEVASQAETVATADEEMSTTSGDIAHNCQLAVEEARRAALSAQNGAAVVDKTVAVMGEIAAGVQAAAQTVEGLGARSDQIGAIIGTIEDIADQTNLLALNAAIEAARAGEQGRGFAVVADEVRALAERTTKATREIGGMIQSIQGETKEAVAAMSQGEKQVKAGTMEASKSGAALREIQEQVDTVVLQINQVATAAEEQTATTREISTNMCRITQLVQETLEGSQESASAASQLSGNAQELQALVRQFKL